MKVALVCDWLTEVGGAEQVLRVLHQMFPKAPIYTSQYHKRVDKFFGRGRLDVRTGWLNLFPTCSRRLLAPLRQSYFAHLDLSEYDLVISVTGCDAKFVRTRPGAAHLCYCHVPTQYYWGKFEEYRRDPGFGALNPVARVALELIAPSLRRRDKAAAKRPDYFVSISSYAATEIKKYYKREAKIIAPPVAVKTFEQGSPQGSGNYKTKKGKCQTKKSEQIICSFSTSVENSAEAVRFLQKNWGNFYINFSRQVNWKRLDLLVRAAAKLDRPLVLIGDGPEHKRLVRLAKKLTQASPRLPQNRPQQNPHEKTSEIAQKPQIFFLPTLPPKDLKKCLSGAKAFLFPSLEPFGIAPVEALAAGCPVVALRGGGALDYVLEGKNGIFFNSQTEKSLVRAIKKFEASPLAHPNLRQKRTISRSAAPFSEQIFRQKMLKYIHEITR